MAQTKVRSEQFQKEVRYELQTAPGSLPEITNVTTVADVGGSLSSKYFTLNSPTTNYYIWYNITPEAEITNVTTNDGSTLSATGTSDYFTINSPSNNYYVWYEVDSTTTDPAPGGTGIKVSVASTDTNIQVATATATAIDLVADFTAPTTGTDTITVTNNTNGSVTDASAGTSGFNVTVTNQGIDASTDPNPGGTPIQINISADTTDASIASATQSTLDAHAAFSASVSSATVTVTNADAGIANDAVSGTSGFTITLVQQGIDGDIYTVGFDFSTPSIGYATLIIYVDGIKMIEGASENYVSTAPNGVVFDSGSIPTAGQKVEFYGLG